MTLAISTFFASLAGMIVLFLLKDREIKRGAVYMPRLRDYADRKARECKEETLHLGERMKLLPPLANLVLRRVVHELALASAAVARRAEEQAHRLADLVSHKHHFERRATRSEFLMQMGKRTPLNARSPAPEQDRIVQSSEKREK